VISALPDETVGPILVGRSEAVLDVVDLTERVAQSDCCVLIEGESGTGKELVARMLHAAGDRRDGPFIPVNCAGVSETLFESQFFGHVRGAFTGAEQAMAGLVRSADRGTLFMDEIGEFPPALQAKLLRVLQDGEVLPVGTVTPVGTDTRFVAATNRDLQQEVDEGRFREDLFYRLNVLCIRIPPLRERIGDVELLLDHFLDVFATKYQRPTPVIGSEVRQRLAEYPWPGNVRELASWVERLYVTQADPNVLAASLVARKSAGATAPAALLSLAEAERRAVQAAMDSTGGRVNEAARLLQVHRSTLSRKLRDYGLV